MFKYKHIREEDYWIFPILFMNVVAGAAAIWASVIMFRGPALLIAGLGIWITSSKIRRDYGPRRARFHVVATIVAAGLLAWLMYILTN